MGWRNRGERGLTFERTEHSQKETKEGKTKRQVEKEDRKQGRERQKQNGDDEVEWMDGKQPE